MSSDSTGTSNFILALDGINKPELTYYNAYGLQTGRVYRFKLQALNFNGASDESAE
jgi:hypothetical protein